MNNIKLHNLIITIGPSQCGKSHWASLVKEQLNTDYPTLNVQVVSSDVIRARLLGQDLDKYDNKMWYASEGAFAVLEVEIKALMTWPIVAEVIIVDTTGLGSEFRQQMVNLAKEHAYNTTAVIFNYKDRADYLRFGGGEITQRHINRMKYVWRELKIFDSKIEINSPDTDFTLTVPDYKLYNSHFLPDDNYIVVGDVHGQWQALAQLPDRKRIYVGDIVDNAPVEDVVKAVGVVYNDVQSGNAYFTIGNHDAWVVNYWNKIQGHTIETAQEHFQSALELPEDSQLQLQWLVENGRYFYRTPNMIITHAPCRTKYLGKLHTIKKQKVLRYPRLQDYENEYEWQQAIYERFTFLENEGTYPTHIWGHVALSRPFRNRCNIGIDTGAYGGNGLSYYDGITRKYETIPSIKTKDVQLISALFKPTPRQTIDDIEPRMRGRVLWMARNKVNFISGTMTPADVLNGELESFEWAFNYYIKRYGNVVIQPKYMGSRGQVYLFSDPAECYVITRNGYRYRDENNVLVPEFERLIEKFRHEFDNGLYLRILDAEILPWRLLGEGLIDKTFYGYGNVMYQQVQLIQDAGLQKWNEYFKTLPVLRNGIDVGIDEGTKKEVIDQHGHHVWTTYLGWKNLVFPKLDNVSAFLEQVDIYGGNLEPLIKPFSMLKDVGLDGSEHLYLNSDTTRIWNFLNDDPIMLTADLNVAFAFYEDLTKNQQLEGVVLKPPQQLLDGNLPYIKVRNPEYLRIVYGPSYLESIAYNKLVQRKKIRNKVRASLVEWESGWKMLAVPYNRLNEDNTELVQLYINHALEDFGVIDPRL